MKTSILRWAAPIGVLLACPAPAMAQITSNDGQARVDHRARMIGVQRVEFVVRCPAYTSAVCQGRATLRTQRRIRVGNARSSVVIATGTFADLEPGETVRIRARVRAAARRYVAARRSIDAIGRVANQRPEGVVRTLDAVTIRNRFSR